MRNCLARLGLLAPPLLALSGCTGGAGSSEPADMLGLVAGITVDALSPGAADEVPTTPATSTAPAAQTFTGRVSGPGQWQMLELGPRAAGARVSVTSALFSPTFVVALFNEHDDLQLRSYMSAGARMSLVVRQNSANLKLGVMAPVTAAGGEFRLSIESDTAGVPSAAGQVVWLNFAGGRNIRIANQAPTSFDAFDGALVGADYVGHSAEMKQSITASMRDDYFGYNVTILSSDDGPPPPGDHSVIHFGSYSSGLLGLADTVDAFNSNANQNAIVFVESFAPYWTMRLTPAQMGVMMANVGSHELGHLLGLFHTRAPVDIMDTTGTAWELAADQSFVRAPLEDSVFATGMEDSPTLLALTVGENPSAGAKATAVARRMDDSERALRRAAQQILEGACGTCRHLDAP